MAPTPEADPLPSSPETPPRPGSAEVARGGGTFAALAITEYRRYWSALLLTFFALWLASITRGFVAFELTGSSAALGGVFLAFGIPQLALTLPGGLLADRVPRKFIVMGAVTFFAVEYASVGALLVTGVLEYWMLIVASSFEGAVIAFYIPARSALVGDLVPEQSLGNAMALQQVSFNSTRVPGPLLAGPMIATAAIGPGGTYLAAAALFAAAAIAMSRLPRRGVSASSRKAASPLAEVLGGLAYIRRRPALLVLILTSYTAAGTGFAYIAFLPAYVAEVFDRGAIALGLLNAAVAVGALTAALVGATIVDGPRAWRAHTLAAAAFSLSLAGLAFAPTFEVALLLGVLVGAGEIGFLTLNQALTMRFTEPDYYGRIQSVLMLGFALFGILALPIGALADAIGIRETLVVQAVVGSTLLFAIRLLARARNAEADARRPDLA